MPSGNWRPWRRATRWQSGGPAAWVIGGCLLVPSLAAAEDEPAQPGGPHVPDVAFDLTIETRTVLPAPATGGFIEHRTLALHGIPVRGARESVRISDEGVATTLRARDPIPTPQLRPEQARVERAAVAGLIADSRGMANEPLLEEPPTLVYLMILGEPVLAWETQLALSMSPEPTRPTIWVSAASGLVLREIEQVRSSRARIFAENPSATPEPIEIELLDIDVDEAGHPLVGTRVQTFNCVDVEPDPDDVSPWWEEEECWPIQTVFSDDNGDFFVPLPDVVLLPDNIDGSDPYAELSMYVHAEIYLEQMAARGIDTFSCEQASMLANFRTLEPHTSLPYTPLNNAYYTNQCDPERGPTMIFGQGTEVDFGFDADVIYHELGHGTVAHLSPEGLGQRRLRSDGSLLDSGAVNEALADYFSAMITEDPHLADYVGRFWSTNGKAFIRDAENDKRCPDDTVGQVHNDGEPFMAALWATRKRFEPPAQAVLDRVVLEALMLMRPDTSLEEATGHILDIAEARHFAGELSGDEWALLIRSFDTRGLIECPRVLTMPAQVSDGRTLILRRVDSAVYPFYPGPRQMRYVVPEGADDMVVSFTLRPRGNEEPVNARVLIKREDAPIEFEYRLVAVDDPPIDPVEDPPEDPLRELTLVTGDWDYELEATEMTPSDYQLVFGGLEPGEVVHVAWVNLSRGEATVTDAMLSSSNGWPTDEESDGSVGSGAADLPPESVYSPAGTAGCACRSTGTETSWTGAWLLALLGWGRRRRWVRR